MHYEAARTPARVTHKARNGAVLFGAASLVTLLGLLRPHQAEIDTFGLGVVAAGPAVLALMDLGPIATSRWLTVIGLVTGAAIVVRLLTEHVERLLAELAAAARTDGLTGLANRRALEQDYTREAARSARTGEPLALVLIDLNRFKRINDLYGHAAGDAAPVWIARTMGRVLRRTDVAARLGGDEFALLLPNADAPAATAVATRLAKLATAGEDDAIPVGLSFGVAISEAGAESLDNLTRLADRALYESKRAAIASPTPITASRAASRSSCSTAPGSPSSSR